MWLDQKIVELLPTAVKQRFSGYYRRIRPAQSHQAHPPLTKAQRRRRTLAVWLLAGGVAAVLILSIIIGF